MQVQHVDGRHRVVGQDQVRRDSDDPAIDFGLRNVATAELDDVLAGLDVDRTVREVELLRDGYRRRRRRAGDREARDAESEDNETGDPSSHPGTIAVPKQQRKQPRIPPTPQTPQSRRAVWGLSRSPRRTYGKGPVRTFVAAARTHVSESTARQRRLRDPTGSEGS